MIRSILTMSLIGLTIASQAQKTAGKLDFNPDKYQAKTLTLNNKTFTVRAFEKIVYVENPVDTIYQVMNIYIPEEYFAGKGINGYTARTAPVFFPNQIGGYMPGKPATTEPSRMGPRRNTVVEALSRGYIVASAGARGRTKSDGKAPAAIVDLKAAVRYLKFNDKRMPGDANKIISNGTSAGGAISALLGATGNNADYDGYLKSLGAANATDDIFAVSAYCPITNLDHADMAYEWQFYGINTYKRGGPMAASDQGPKNLTVEQIQISKDLKDAFPAYVNALQLKDNNGKALALDADGNGSFKALVKSYVMASAQIAINSGKDLSAHSWLAIGNGKVTGLDWDKYLVYLERQKTPPAFDALDGTSPENQVFGTASADKQHFTRYGQEHSASGDASVADAKIVKMMNPMNYIGAPETQPAKHWRIRHGSKDKDTGLAISVMLATLLENKGYDVNFVLPWDVPHSGDYDLDELFDWIDTKSK